MMFYNYLFYYLYILVSKTPSKKDAVFMTILAMILPITLNIVPLIGYVKYIFELKFDLSNTFIIVLSVLLLCVNYILYMHNDRCLKVIKDIELKSNDTYWKWIMIAYGFVSIFIFFCGS